MKLHKFIFPVLLIGVIPTLFRKMFGADISQPNLKINSANPKDLEGVETFIKNQMARLKIPGISFVIVEGDQIIHQGGFGKISPSGPAPTTQTPFVLGSTTKSITACAVMQLVEIGQVDLDAPIQRYLPWFRVADPVASEKINVRHLLNQTSGLPMIRGMANLANLDDSPDAGLRQCRALEDVKLSHPVGTTFEYSNLNYNLLGLIIEAASGKTYTNYLKSHIFAPLEMDHSYTAIKDAKKVGMAVGHRYWFGYPVAIDNLPLARGSMPSGQLISCSEDLAHYLIAHLNNGHYAKSKILSSLSIDEMQVPSAEQLVLGKPVTAYGMGWFINEVDGVKVVSHGGNVPEFSSYMAIIPEQNKGVVLLANSDQWGLPFILMEVGDGVTALLAGKQPEPIKLGFFPWVMRALPLIPLLQLAGIISTLRRLSNWRHHPESQPKRSWIMMRHLVLGLIPNMVLATIPRFLRSNGLLGYMKLYMPDFSLIVKLSGGIAAFWAQIRTILILRFLRKPS